MKGHCVDDLVTGEALSSPRRTPPTRAERIAQLRARADRLAQQEKSAQRKLETRRKIIVGGMILAAIDHDPALASTVKALLHKLVTRENDRKAIADLL